MIGETVKLMLIVKGMKKHGTITSKLSFLVILGFLDWLMHVSGHSIAEGGWTLAAFFPKRTVPPAVHFKGVSTVIFDTPSVQRKAGHESALVSKMFQHHRLLILSAVTLVKGFNGLCV
jgi:hypothetical protein